MQVGVKFCMPFNRIRVWVNTPCTIRELVESVLTSFDQLALLTYDLQIEKTLITQKST